jgi:hypothetical protein
MTIILSPSTGAAVTDYSQMLDRIASWMHRTDLTATIPDFIWLAEERMNRRLRLPQMEVALTSSTISSNAVAVPDGILGVKALWIPGTDKTFLQSVPYTSLVSKKTTGEPTVWAHQGSFYYFDGTGSIEGVLYTRIPALSSTNTTNWMLDQYPSAYLFGALAEGYAFTGGEEAALYEARFSSVLNDIESAANRDKFSGPLVVRAR